MKYFVCSDIHGYFKELIESLALVGYDSKNEDHKLIVVGDMFDRGPDSKKVFEYLFDLQSKGKAIVVKGNHELFIGEVHDLNEERVKFNIKHNGFQHTLNSFCGEDVSDWELIDIRTKMHENNEMLFYWIDTLPYYYELEDYIFVHSGLILEGDWKECDWKKGVWVKSREFRDIDLSKHGITKKVVHGHVSCRNLRDHDGIVGNDFSIYESADGQKIGIDGTVMKTGRINVYIIDEDVQ